jgi:hypothetical protein
MEKDAEHLNIEFHDRANATFFTSYGDFRSDTEMINRDEQEKAFQEKKHEFILTLRRKLESIAEDITIQNHSNKDLDRFIQNCHLFIDQYINEFIKHAEGS